jgi:hypothetical protein
MFTATVPAEFNGSTSIPKAPSAAGADHSVTWSLDLTPSGDWVDAGSYSATSVFTAVVAP